MSKIGKPALEIGYEYKELEENWWKSKDWLFPREEEPTAFEAMHDFMINKIVPNPKSVEIAGYFVPRIILLEVLHPKREPEFVRIMLSPTDIAPGVPDAESDLIIKIQYYDLMRVLDAEEGFDVMTPLWGGNAFLIGNVTAGLDLKDLLDAANNKPHIARPSIWPMGNP
ncbi:MAG: hypothetical protein HWN67_11940 [Candidatus Helarchaeota archaeon]|nr:hypothetical protein [Candidatus Helarchaeota archaeon]